MEELNWHTEIGTNEKQIYRISIAFPPDLAIIEAHLSPVNFFLYGQQYADPWSSTKLHLK